MKSRKRIKKENQERETGKESTSRQKQVKEYWSEVWSVTTWLTLVPVRKKQIKDLYLGISFK